MRMARKTRSGGKARRQWRRLKLAWSGFSVDGIEVHVASLSAVVAVAVQTCA